MRQMSLGPARARVIRGDLDSIRAPRYRGQQVAKRGDSKGKSPSDPGPTKRFWSDRNKPPISSPANALSGEAAIPGFDNEESTTSVTNISLISDNPLGRKSCLVVIHGDDLGRRYDLDKIRIKLGRTHLADITIDNEAVSRNHAEIREDNGNYVLVDLGSTNGTFVNDVRVNEAILRDGNLVKIGRTIFKYLSTGNIETAYHEEIYRLTTIDGLTQIHNRRFFFEALTKELSRAKRYRRVVSLAMFDLDRFKRLNDELGHLAGDQVLKEVATLIKERIRREDIFARYGGEEFAVILPELTLAQARAFGEKIRGVVSGHEFGLVSRVQVTISIGVATWDGVATDPEVLVHSADTRLLEAKSSGRDRVCG